LIKKLAFICRMIYMNVSETHSPFQLYFNGVLGFLVIILV
jgi:hypothetical protein